jgi:ParB-like chromosome segregation protein Spo0J
MADPSVNASRRPWPADRVERRRVADLVPYARNARTHSDEQVAQIAASIEAFGWTIPVLVDEAGELIAGHGRVLAAKRLGIEKVPAMVARGWSQAQKAAYVIADNQLALNAGWDEDLLRIEIGALDDLGFDTDLLGFDAAFLAGMLAEPAPASGDPDDVPDVDESAPAVSRPGDVWLLGASFECEECGKQFSYEEGRKRAGVCGCDED